MPTRPPSGLPTCRCQPIAADRLGVGSYGSQRFGRLFLLPPVGAIAEIADDVAVSVVDGPRELGPSSSRRDAPHVKLPPRRPSTVRAKTAWHQTIVSAD